MKQIFLIFTALLFFFSLEAQNNTEENQLTVFLVRHAEKMDSSADPELSEAGKQRAVVLAETLASAKIDYIYSTDYIRTRETAVPTARHFNLDINLYNPHKLEAFAAELKQKVGRHLVVGHSNTTPMLVKLLGGEAGSEINEKSEYDRLYVITVSSNGNVNTVLLRYGNMYNP